MTDHQQLPAVIAAGTVTALPSGHLVPAADRRRRRRTGWRYIDFFTSNIRNPNTRRAYARACQRFFGWCDERGLTLPAIRPYSMSPPI